MIARILILLGANMAVGSLAAATYFAHLGCAIEADDAQCRRPLVQLFIEWMTSEHGVVFWVVACAGLLLIWQGWRMRARDLG